MMDGREQLLGAKDRHHDGNIYENTRKAAQQRGDETTKLLSTTDRLRESLREQAELARALREKEQQKHASSEAQDSRVPTTSKVTRKTNKRKRMGHKARHPTIEEVTGSESGEDRLKGSNDLEDLEPHHSQESSQTHSHNAEDILTEDDLRRAVVERNADIDNMVENMFDRAREIQSQADVAFAKTDIQQQALRNTRRRWVIWSVVAIVTLVVISIVIYVIVRAVR